MLNQKLKKIVRTLNIHNPVCFYCSMLCRFTGSHTGGLSTGTGSHCLFNLLSIKAKKVSNNVFQPVHDIYFYEGPSLVSQGFLTV